MNNISNNVRWSVRDIACRNCGVVFQTNNNSQKLCGSRPLKAGCAWKILLATAKANTTLYRAQSPEHRKLIDLRWRRGNKDKIKARQRRYYLNHKKEIGIKSFQYHLRRKGVPGTITVESWRSLLALYGNRCAWCGSYDDISIDHKIPVSKGGTNYLENLQPLCMPCNQSKNDRTWFASWLITSEHPFRTITINEGLHRNEQL